MLFVIPKVKLLQYIHLTQTKSCKKSYRFNFFFNKKTTVCCYYRCIVVYFFNIIYKNEYNDEYY